MIDDECSSYKSQRDLYLQIVSLGNLVTRLAALTAGQAWPEVLHRSRGRFMVSWMIGSGRNGAWSGCDRARRAGADLGAMFGGVDPSLRRVRGSVRLAQQR